MSGVDYSKWDKMASEMSDSDDDNGNNPEVTTFDQPQSVTFGGTSASQAAEGWDGASDDSGAHPDTTPSSSGVAAPADGSTGAVAAAATGTTPTPQVKPLISDERLTENGAAVRGDANAGRQALQYVWRQTRAEVVVVVPVPAGTRAGDVEVSLRAKPETIAEGVADLIRVAVKATRGRDGAASRELGTAATAPGGGTKLVPVLEGELAFQAKLGAEDEGEVEWELKDYPGTAVARDDPDSSGDPVGSAPPPAPAAGAREASSSSNGDRRGVEIVLKKHCPVPNAAVWWKSLLKGGPEIDVAAIKGRATNNHQSVWEEALGMFKEQVAARKGQPKISVDMEEGDS
ncbi:unnamed protein product [Ectocarpus sp. CCAP 1310/34]|nr:unnamed protein product [Ectocarpus sp. CCAP 1310/34]